MLRLMQRRALFVNHGLCRVLLSFIILSFARTNASVHGQLPALDGFIKGSMKDGGIPGLSALVVNATDVLWTGVFGYADPKLGINVTRDTLFTVGSISKTVISFVVMQLFDKGLFRLDDAVDKYIGFPLRNPHYQDIPVTIRQLLSHTSSISDDEDDGIGEVRGDSKVMLAVYLKAYLVPGGQYYSRKHCWHEWRPGQKYAYSNVGAALAAYLAERVAARAIADRRLTRKELLGRQGASSREPITFDVLARALFREAWDVRNVGYYISEIDIHNLAMPSKKQKSGGFKDYCFYGYPDYPDGLWRTTPLAYSTLFRTFISFGVAPPLLGGKEILSHSTATMMRNVSEGARHARGQGDEPQALIWYYSSDWGKQLLGHSGGDDGIDTDAFFNPDTGVGFIVFTNGDGTYGWEDPTYDQNMNRIEKKLMETFDVHGDWPSVEPPASTMLRLRRRRGSRKRHRKHLPCGLPAEDAAPLQVYV